MSVLKKCAAGLVVAFVSYAIGAAFPVYEWWAAWGGGALSIGAMHLIDRAEGRT